MLHEHMAGGISSVGKFIQAFAQLSYCSHIPLPLHNEGTKPSTHTQKSQRNDDICLFSALLYGRRFADNFLGCYAFFRQLFENISYLVQHKVIAVMIKDYCAKNLWLKKIAFISKIWIRIHVNI